MSAMDGWHLLVFALFVIACTVLSGLWILHRLAAKSVRVAAEEARQARRVSEARERAQRHLDSPGRWQR